VFASIEKKMPSTAGFPVAQAAYRSLALASPLNEATRYIPMCEAASSGVRASPRSKMFRVVEAIQSQIRETHSKLSGSRRAASCATVSLLIRFCMLYGVSECSKLSGPKLDQSLKDRSNRLAGFTRLQDSEGRVPTSAVTAEEEQKNPGSCRDSQI
jgi:hypothetical protein